MVVCFGILVTTEFMEPRRIKRLVAREAQFSDKDDISRECQRCRSPDTR